jgi:hypothetical protein
MQVAEEEHQPQHSNINILLLLLMVVQSFVVPRALFQFLNAIHSRTP